jgi:hypothetical protein
MNPTMLGRLGILVFLAASLSKYPGVCAAALRQQPALLDLILVPG